jgi:hypothetical protein
MIACMLGSPKNCDRPSDNPASLDRLVGLGEAVSAS